MNVRKFSAATSREALRLVRDTLGPDAVILSNRSQNGVVEILALAGEDMASLAEPVRERAPRRREPEPEPYADADADAESFPTIPNTLPVSVEPLVAAFASRRVQAASPRDVETVTTTPHQSTARSTANVAPELSATSEMQAMMNEIRSMRGMLESQLAEIAWGSKQQREPIRAMVMRETLAAGFSASLARYLVEKLPAAVQAADGISWIKSVLTRNLSAVTNEDAILQEGGVFALVGPTGVGKTTTTAKLAARFVMRHGASKLALITTDGYRIGGYEQLRIYGKILGVMVHSVKDESDLRIALAELRNKHTVLIDTAGASQRDEMVAQQVAMLSGADTPVKRLLCLPATSTGETLNEVVRAYRGEGLAGCIMTKIDEAATIGSVLDVIIRQKLQLYYVANGQRVPEDLHLARPAYLVDRAFKLKRETAPFQLRDDELPLVIGNAASAMNDRTLQEVSLG
jgi:flagellar biosynthesis protein FlhF